MPILEGLDPNGFITYRLFRDATKYTSGTHVKVCICYLYHVI
jgi:import inner membrane translocase subunit TIM50